MAWKRLGVALLRIPSINTSMLASGTPVSWACFSIRVTPQDEIPARKASPLVMASLGPDGESRTKCCCRAWLRERPRTPLDPDRTESILTLSAMLPPGGTGHRAADDEAAAGPCQARYHRASMSRGLLYGLPGSHVIFLLSTWAVVSFLGRPALSLACTVKRNPHASPAALAQLHKIIRVLTRRSAAHV